MELGPLNIKQWDTGEKNGKIGQHQAELLFFGFPVNFLFFTIYNHSNGAAEHLLSIFCAWFMMHHSQQTPKT